MPEEVQAAPTKSWWQRRILAPLRLQLTQGVTPAQLALALAIGGVIAVNPFLGTTTVACIAAGILLRLNQPVLQIANILSAPIQLALIIPWIRMGEWLYRAEPMPINPKTLVEEISVGPWQFLQRFGQTSLYAASAWLLFAPFIGMALYYTLLPPLRAFGRQLKKGQIA